MDSTYKSDSKLELGKPHSVTGERGHNQVCVWTCLVLRIDISWCIPDFVPRNPMRLCYTGENAECGNYKAINERTIQNFGNMITRV